MASEVRRTARALVEPTPARFVAAIDADAANQRLAAELSAGRRLDGEIGERLRFWEPGRARGLAAARFEGRWTVSDAGPAIEGAFVPSPRMQPFLRTLSALLALLLAASGLVLFTADAPPAIRFLIPLTTVFAIFGFPLAILALGSQKLAAEARLSKHIKACLAEPEESSA